MKNQFVHYDLALKLKELGFDEECFGFYDNKNKYLIQLHSSKDKNSILAPLFQQIFDWFREKHHIDSVILPTSSPKYIYRLYEQQSKSKTQIYGEYMGKEYETYEEARQACLEKLIEITKI